LVFSKKLNNALKGQQFANIPNIQCNVTLLKGTPEKDFKGCFWQWDPRLKKYTASQGQNFQDDSSR
jgi:hypothetical protein